MEPTFHNISFRYWQLLFRYIQTQISRWLFSQTGFDPSFIEKECFCFVFYFIQFEVNIKSEMALEKSISSHLKWKNWKFHFLINCRTEIRKMNMAKFDWVGLTNLISWKCSIDTDQVSMWVCLYVCVCCWVYSNDNKSQYV